MNKIVSITILLLCSHLLFSQAVYHRDLKKSFAIAKKNGKSVLVIITHDDKAPINAANTLDSCLHDSIFSQQMDKSYVLCKIKINELNKCKHASMKQVIRRYPNQIFCFSNDAIPFSVQYYFSKSDCNASKLIRCIDSCQKTDLPIIRGYMKGVSNKTIDTLDLLKWIRLQARLGVDFTHSLNLYAKKGAHFTTEIHELVDRGEWLPLDCYFMKSLIYKENKKMDEINFVTSVLSTAMDMSIFFKDQHMHDLAIKGFEQVLNHYNNIINNHSNALLYALTPRQREIDEYLLKSKFEFSCAIKKAKNIDYYGGMYIDFLMKTGQTKFKEIQERNDAFSTFFLMNNIRTNGLDTAIVQGNVALAEKIMQNEDSVLKQEFMNEEASTFNNIAWNFYLNVNSEASLKKALSLSQLSIKLNPTHFYFDTYAHLLFKLKKIKEAIEYEKMAITLLQRKTVPVNNKLLTEYQTELNKFEGKIK